jgi:hypothetical protein
MSARWSMYPPSWWPAGWWPLGSAVTYIRDRRYTVIDSATPARGPIVEEGEGSGVTVGPGESSRYTVG